MLGSSRGFVARIAASYEAVKVEMVRKYFLSTLSFARLYMEGADAYTVNPRMTELRKVKKGHRERLSSSLWRLPSWTEMITSWSESWTLI